MTRPPTTGASNIIQQRGFVGASQPSAPARLFVSNSGSCAMSTAAEELVQVLQTGKVSKLKLNNDSLTEDEIQWVCREVTLLKDRCRVSELSLWSNDPLRVSSASVLADMLKVNRSITRLDLADCRLGADAGLALASGLASNSAVRHLDLSINRLGDSASALMCGNGVTRICLSGNDITDEGAAGIGEQLKFSRKLFEIDLSFNSIGDAGAKHIGSGVASSPTVAVVNLSGNRLTPGGVGVLCDCIKDNRTILDVDLSRNEPHLGADTQHVLRQLLKSNRQRRDDIRTGTVQPTCISVPPMASSNAPDVDQAALDDNVKNLIASADQDITIDDTNNGSASLDTAAVPIPNPPVPERMQTTLDYDELQSRLEKLAAEQDSADQEGGGNGSAAAPPADSESAWMDAERAKYSEVYSADTSFARIKATDSMELGAMSLLTQLDNVPDCSAPETNESVYNRIAAINHVEVGPSERAEIKAEKKETEEPSVKAPLPVPAPVAVPAKSKTPDTPPSSAAIQQALLDQLVAEDSNTSLYDSIASIYGVTSSGSAPPADEAAKVEPAAAEKAAVPVPPVAQTPPPVDDLEAYFADARKRASLLSEADGLLATLLGIQASQNGSAPASVAGSEAAPVADSVPARDSRSGKTEKRDDKAACSSDDEDAALVVALQAKIGPDLQAAIRLLQSCVEEAQREYDRQLQAARKARADAKAVAASAAAPPPPAAGSSRIESLESEVGTLRSEKDALRVEMQAMMQEMSQLKTAASSPAAPSAAAPVVVDAPAKEEPADAEEDVAAEAAAFFATAQASPQTKSFAEDDDPAVRALWTALDTAPQADMDALLGPKQLYGTIPAAEFDSWLAAGGDDGDAQRSAASDALAEGALKEAADQLNDEALMAKEMYDAAAASAGTNDAVSAATLASLETAMDEAASAAFAAGKNPFQVPSEWQSQLSPESSLQLLIMSFYGAADPAREEKLQTALKERQPEMLRVLNFHSANYDKQDDVRAQLDALNC